MKKYFILAAAAAMFAACSNNDDAAQNEITTERIPLTIGTSFGSVANVITSHRSNNVSYQSDALINTNGIGLFVFQKDGTTITESAYERINVSCTSPTQVNSSKYYSITPASSLYYPDTKSQELDFYAYAPYISATSGDVSKVPASFTDISSQKVTFYTEIDQTEDANYLKSDVIWGCAGTGSNIVAAANTASGSEGPYELLKNGGTNQANNNTISATAWQTAKNAYTTTLSSTAGELDAYYVESATKADVRIPMLHRGSKIIVQLKTDGSMSYTKLQKAKVSLGIDHKIGELNIASGEFLATDAATASYVVLTSRLGWSGSANEGAYEYPVGTQVGYQCAAVIIPQTPSSAKTAGQFIKIELGDGSTWNNGTYAWTPDTAPEFKSGKVYTYTITVKASGLDVAASVSDWVDGFVTPESGNATLQ